MRAIVTGWLRRHRIDAFFVLAYAIAWGLEGVIVGETVQQERLTGLYVSHALITWLVALAVLLVAGTGLAARRVRRRRVAVAPVEH